MIISNQANPLSALLSATSPQPASLMGSAQGTSQARFDLTLLQATKQAFDSAVTDPAAEAVPEKVRKALESVLNTLGQQAPEAQTAPANGAPTTDVQNAVVDQAAAAGNLTQAQRQQLGDLVEMAVERMQSSPEPANTSLNLAAGDRTTRAFSVLNSGPQGGTTVSQTSTINASDAQPAAPSARRSDLDPARQLPQLAAAFPAPILVSTRTQDVSVPASQSASPVTGAPILEAGPVTAPVQENAQQVYSSQAPGAASQNQNQEATVVQPDPQSSGGNASFVSVVQAFSADSAESAPLAAPQIMPDNQNHSQIQTTQSQMNGIGGRDLIRRAAFQTEPNRAPAVQGQASQPSQSGQPPSAPSRGTVQAPVQASVSTPFQPPDAPEIEFSPSGQAQPQVVPGSEVTLTDFETVLSQQVQRPPADVAVPQAGTQPQGHLDRTVSTGVAGNPVSVQAQLPIATAQQPRSIPSHGEGGAQPAAASAPAALAATPASPAIPAAVLGAAPSPVEVSVQEFSGDNSQPAQPAAADQGPDSRTITPFQRFLDDTAAKAVVAGSPGPVQAQLPLGQESVKDLAQNVTRQYALRQSLLTQVQAAVDEASQGQNQIRIQLKPAALGTLDVSLSIEGGKLTARLIAGNSEVRDVLAGNLAQFKQALESQGLQVNQLSVAVRADAGSPQGQGQQQWQQNQSLWLQAQAEDAPLAQNPWAGFLASGSSAQESSTFSALA
jgi:flagellar hook-length control protein FliK